MRGAACVARELFRGQEGCGGSTKQYLLNNCLELNGLRLPALELGGHGLEAVLWPARSAEDTRGAWRIRSGWNLVHDTSRPALRLDKKKPSCPQMRGHGASPSYLCDRQVERGLHLLIGKMLLEVIAVGSNGDGHGGGAGAPPKVAIWVEPEISIPDELARIVRHVCAPRGLEPRCQAIVARARDVQPASPMSPFGRHGRSRRHCLRTQLQIHPVPSSPGIRPRPYFDQC